MGSAIAIVEWAPERMGELLRVPSRFEVIERAVIEGGRVTGTVPVANPSWKDYDSYPEDRLDRLPLLYQVASWGLLCALKGDQVVGGLVLAAGDASFEPLEGRLDLGWIVDVRVHPNFQGQGIGQELWHAAERWAMRRGLVELRVETQDVNLAACRFYERLGCHILSNDPHAYPPEMIERRIIWSMGLARQITVTD